MRWQSLNVTKLKKINHIDVALTHKSVKLFLVGAIASGLIIGIFSWTGLVGHAQGSLQITGTVTDPNGNGLNNVSVYATNPGGTTVEYGPTTTASNGTSDGTYELDVDPGTYDFHFVSRIQFPA